MTYYDYLVEGQGGEGTHWTVAGEVSTEREGDFPQAVNAAFRDTFTQLTNGTAMYGQPGISCSGPYRINSFSLTRRPDLS